ncbi:hypothetical protein GCM10009555_008450 [Acrocarpospora macrocephala]|uniref:BioF2-like acetyltransferase domain-containing protein n=1 Tax=Acrocarpospora macrocephala TaxID=150177 RepID=A0A5M3X2P7_9ACTN|nr:GNAT family N-acetyltransferase [Acrocarpospora macrocephala]GES14872.1 hypothetical protein Amac_084690 [Acrocarpospora macrocephala]
MYSTEVLDTITSVDPAEWDALGEVGDFTGHRWLRLAERVLAGHRPRYLLLRRRGRLVAAAACTLEQRLQNPALEARFGWVLRRTPYLHVGVPMMSKAGLLAQGGELAALCRELRALTRRERAPFSVIDHLPVGHPAWSGLDGCHALAMAPETRMDVEWSSFEEYLGSLPRKRRQEVRRVARRSLGEGITVRPLAERGDPRLDRLVGDVVQRHHGIHRFVPGLFEEAAAVLGDDLTVLAAYRHGELAGCVALLRDGDDLSAKWIGRDYGLTEGTSAYHALVAACVRTAIALGVRRVHFGASAYETKKQFGVCQEPRGGLLAMRSPILNRCVGWPLRRMS